MRIVPLDVPVVLLGRGAAMDIVLGDLRAAREHLRIEVEGEQITFQNLAEDNPLLFNGTPRFTGRLRPGDVLRLGDTEIVLLEQAPALPLTRLPKSAAQGLSLTAGIEKARIGLLEEIVKVLPGREDADGFYRRLLSSLFRIMDVRRTFVAMRVGKSGPARQVAYLNREEGGGPIKMSRTIVNRVLGSGIGLLASDAMADPDLSRSDSVVDLGIKSVICVPIHRGDEVVGVFYADNRMRTRSFVDEDLRFMTLIARIVSVQVENQEMALELREENLRLRRILDGQEDFVTASPALKDLLKVAQKAAVSDANILITGETGSGKNLLARTLHRLSHRAERAFVEVSCAAIPDNLLEAEMFGYGPQSGIAGANPKGREGYFVLAADGSILLDEIGDLSLPLQAKILHAIEEGRFRRLGSNTVHEVRCRIISATNQDLERAIQEGRFREDLYYRLRVVPLKVPPLRDRPEDILPLAEFFLRHLAPDRRTRLNTNCRSLLLSHAWPGNVRELRNAISRALAVGEGNSIDPELLRQCLEAPENQPPSTVPTLEQVQLRHIQHVVSLYGGNKKRAAKALGISRSTLYARLANRGV